jgi:hypothetical protein
LAQEKSMGAAEGDGRAFARLKKVFQVILKKIAPMSLPRLPVCSTDSTHVMAAKVGTPQRYDCALFGAAKKGLRRFDKPAQHNLC